MTSNEQQQSSLPPLQPTYVLRGHAAQIHSVQFLSDNSRLLTGDADGWLVMWGVVQKRAVAVWKAHDAAILGTNTWGTNRILSHGRDSSLKVWQLQAQDEPLYSTTLPIEDETSGRQKPWLLHSLAVNTLNFCSFAMCMEPSLPEDPSGENGPQSEGSPILVAVPGVNDKEINIFHLPSEHRVCVVPVLPKTETGMAMALSFANTSSNSASPSSSDVVQPIFLLVGYEGGHAMIYRLTRETTQYKSTPIYISHPHTQPILSIVPSLTQRSFFTSAADPYLSSHPLLTHSDFPLSIINPSQSFKSSQASLPAESLVMSPPLKSINTGHSGQAALAVRSDGRILASAGWDGRVRIFSAKSMKELAVLKWHKTGCYAVAFAAVLDAPNTSQPAKAISSSHQSGNGDVARREEMRGLGKVLKAREEKARTTHWVAVGSKDGNVSLWDVY